MATRLATFTQAERGNPTSDEMYISQSDTDSGAIYVQLIKKGDPHAYDQAKRRNKMMHFKIRPEDIDDMIIVLQYAKQEIIK